MPHPSDVPAALAMLRAPADVLWPGFSPLRVPLVVYGAGQTTLHGADPPDAGWDRAEACWTRPGRHPDLTANTALRLGGELPAAGLLLDDLPAGMDVAELAALVAHEAFHVLQHQAGWTPDLNEFDALTYPETDPEVLLDRAQEAAALRSALSAGPQDWANHAAQALAWRSRRHTRLDEDHARYERTAERHEGTATHVELTVLGRLPLLWDAATEPPPTVRAGAYQMGAAYAALLTRAAVPGWHAAVAAGEALNLLLRPHVPTVPVPPEDPALRRSAVHHAHALEAERRQAREAMLGQPGARLVVTSSRPLQLRAFDPMNLRLLGGGEVLHRRFVQFAAAGLSGEVLGTASLMSAPAGAHPIWGATRLDVPGLRGAQLSEDGLNLTAEGLTLRSDSAPICQEGDIYRIEV